MLHSMMPVSSANQEKAEAQPAMYTDVGATMLLQALYDLGATKANLSAKVIGAASHVDHNGVFRIGEKNYAVARKVLWKNGILITAEDIGGTVSRTVYFEVGTGRVYIRSEQAVHQL